MRIKNKCKKINIKLIIELVLALLITRQLLSSSLSFKHMANEDGHNSTIEITIHRRSQNMLVTYN